MDYSAIVWSSRIHLRKPLCSLPPVTGDAARADPFLYTVQATREPRLNRAGLPGYFDERLQILHDANVVDERRCKVSEEQSTAERTMIAYALQHPSGRYNAKRTSQLSGVPKTTVQAWQRDGILIPDFSAASPTMWSYRDLVLLRLLTRLRQGGMQRSLAASTVDNVRSQLSRGIDIRHIHATKWYLVLNDRHGDAVPDDRDNLMPSQEFYSLLGTFELHKPIDELRSKRDQPIWAPDLLAPSAHSAISPWVLAGEPCITQTRIPTAAVLALHTERALSSNAIASLYPGLSVDAVDDAVELERRLRGCSEHTAA